MGQPDHFRRTNTPISENQVAHDSNNGHTHDGKNSAPVQLQPGQVQLQHIHKDTIRYLTMPDQSLKHMPFTLSGPLSTSTSPPYVPHRPTNLVGIHAVFGTAGTTNTVFNILQNSNPIQQFTVDVQGIVTQPWTTTTADGKQFHSPFVYLGLSIAEPCGPYDTLQVQIATVGAGAADLVVLMLFNDSSSLLI